MGRSLKLCPSKMEGLHSLFSFSEAVLVSMVMVGQEDERPGLGLQKKTKRGERERNRERVKERL